MDGVDNNMYRGQLVGVRLRTPTLLGAWCFNLGRYVLGCFYIKTFSYTWRSVLLGFLTSLQPSLWRQFVQCH